MRLIVIGTNRGNGKLRVLPKLDGVCPSRRNHALPFGKVLTFSTSVTSLRGTLRVMPLGMRETINDCLRRCRCNRYAISPGEFRTRMCRVTQHYADA